MDVSRSATWVSLGKLIPTTQQLDASEVPPLGADGKGPKDHPTACIMGKRYTRKQCFLRALELDNDDHEAWFLLGKCIEDFEQDPPTPIGAPKWSPNPCVEVPTWESPPQLPGANYGSTLLDRRNVNSYMMSGNEAVVLPRRSTRRLYSKQQCYARALECALLQLEAMTAAAEVRVRAQDGTEGLVVAVPNTAPLWMALWNTLTKAVPPRSTLGQSQDPLADSTGSIRPVSSTVDETLPDTSTDSVAILGKHYDKEACAIHAVEADPLLGCAWNAVGVSIAKDASTTLVIQKRENTEEISTARLELLTFRLKVADLGSKGDAQTIQVTKLDCFVNALDRGEEGNTKVWTNAAALMGTNQVNTILVHGKERTKADCYAMAVKLSDMNSMAWLGLGLSLGAAGSPQTPLSVDIGSVSRLHCLRRSVESDLYNGRGWVDLGIEVAIHANAASSVTKGVRILAAERLVQGAKAKGLPCPRTIADPVRRGGFTAKDCYIRALELNSTIAEAWSRLGMVLSGTLSQDTIEGAMNMDVDARVAEVLRVAKMRISVEKDRRKKLKEVSKMKVRVEREIATGQPPEDSEGDSSTTTIPSTASSNDTTESELADRTAFKEERRWVRNYSRIKTGKTALSGIHTAYSLLDSVTIRGRPVTKIDCHLRCLELEPDKSRSWCNMGTGCAYVAGAAKQLEVFIKGWQADNSGDINDGLEEVTDVNDDDSDSGSEDCLDESQVVTAAPPSAMFSVIGSLDQELQGILPSRQGSYYSQRRCYVRAVELDPTASIAWSGLGMTLRLAPFVGGHSPQPSIPVVSWKLKEDPFKAVINLDNPTTVDRVECFIRSAADPHESLRSDLWVDLGDCIARPHLDPYTLATTGYAVDSRIISVNTPLDLSAVGGPADTPPGKRSALPTQRVGAVHCFCKAVQLDPDNATAWYRLGLEMLHLQTKKDQDPDPAISRVTVACCNIPPEDIERRLLRAIDAQGGLMVDDTVTAIGAIYCFTAAVEVCVSEGVHYNPIKALAASSTAKPEFNLFGASWAYLGVCLTQGRLSRCKPWKKGSGSAVDRQGAYFQALEFDPHVRLAWRELGELLVDGWFTYNTVSIRGREYTKRECTEKSQQLPN